MEKEEKAYSSCRCCSTRYKKKYIRILRPIQAFIQPIFIKSSLHMQKALWAGTGKPVVEGSWVVR